MQKCPAMGRPISFRDNTAPHVSAVYSWQLNGHKLAWQSGVYALLYHFNSRRVGCYWSILSVQWATWAKVAQKLCCTAKIMHFVNKAQIAEKLHAARSQFSGATKEGATTLLCDTAVALAEVCSLWAHLVLLWTVCSWCRGWKKCCRQCRWFSLGLHPSHHRHTVRLALRMRAPSQQSCWLPTLIRRRWKRRKFRRFLFLGSLQRSCSQNLLLDAEDMIVTDMQWALIDCLMWNQDSNCWHFNCRWCDVMLVFAVL